MNFYKRFIGDIQKKTGHLSLAEFGAYDRLLDHYYALEKPLPLLIADCYRICRAMVKDERAAVDRVLGEFFERTEAGYVHTRAEEAMAEALPKIEANRLNGKKGGRPKKNPAPTQKEPTGLFDGTQGEANANLSQSQSNSVTDVTGGEPPTDRELLFSNGVALLTVAGVAEKHARSMLAGLSKAHGDAAVVKALNDCAAAQAVEPVSWIQNALRTAGKPRATGAPNKHAAAAAAIFEGATHV